MTEFDVKRVVIACDAATDTHLAVTEAAELAARWGAALHGIYFEDENLLRLAELEIAAHIGLSASQPAQTLTGDALKAMLQMYGGVMRRALEAAAVRNRLDWSFGTLRVSPSSAPLPEIDGDILIVEEPARPFSGAWRPRSSWLSMAMAATNTVLLKRHREGHGIVVVAPADAAAYQRVTAAARAFAGPDDELVILSADPRAFAERREVEGRRKVRFEALPSSPAGLLARLAQLDPALLAVGADDPSTASRTIFEGTSCDLLIVK